MTVKAPFISSDGKRTEVDLSSEIFEVQVNVPVLHEAVKGQLAAARSGTSSTKTRAEVRGGGAKPWRQKGTGRARHGSIREPQWVGGGVAHGPKPRDYSMRINKKVKALALRSALTDRAKDGKVLVVDLPEFEEPETKKAVQLLSDWGAEGKTLIVISREQEEELLTVWKSFRNLPEVLMVTYPTAYTVMAADTVVFTQPALAALSEPKKKLSKPNKEEAAPGERVPLQANSDSDSAADTSSQSRANKDESVEGAAAKPSAESSATAADSPSNLAVPAAQVPSPDPVGPPESGSPATAASETTGASSEGAAEGISNEVIEGGEE